jgi:hypothetical protein
MALRMPAGKPVLNLTMPAVEAEPAGFFFAAFLRAAMNPSP